MPGGVHPHKRTGSSTAPAHVERTLFRDTNGAGVPVVYLSDPCMYESSRRQDLRTSYTQQQHSCSCRVVAGSPTGLRSLSFCQLPHRAAHNNIAKGLRRQKYRGSWPDATRTRRNRYVNVLFVRNVLAETCATRVWCLGLIFDIFLGIRWCFPIPAVPVCISHSFSTPDSKPSIVRMCNKILYLLLIDTTSYYL